MRLVDALDVTAGDVVALVGGGGKTSALYLLGDELTAAGVPVVISGSTRFTPPEERQPANLCIIAPDEQLPVLAPPSTWPLTVATGWGSRGRLQPVPPDWVDAWHAAHPDWCIVLEADGSAMRPFKAPAAHEPVIPACATLVVAIAGIDVIGRPLDEQHVHRPERVAALTGASIGAPVDTRMVADVLTHTEGGRRGLPPGARWLPLINKADTPERVQQARALAALLRPVAERVVIARLRHDPPVVAVV